MNLHQHAINQLIDRLNVVDSSKIIALQICEMLKTGGTRNWIPEMEVPYVVKNDQWVGYDDPESLKKKVISILQFS